MADKPPIVRMFEQVYGPFSGMAPGDTAIWVRWLAKGGGVWAPFEYNVRVGNGAELPPDATSFVRDQAYYLTTKRIDALARINGEVTVIEVKQRAGAGALGQMLTYRDLLLQSRPTVTRANMLLITDVLQPDMLMVLTQNGVQVDVVGL